MSSRNLQSEASIRCSVRLFDKLVRGVAKQLNYRAPQWQPTVVTNCSGNCRQAASAYRRARSSVHRYDHSQSHQRRAKSKDSFHCGRTSGRSHRNGSLKVRTKGGLPLSTFVRFSALSIKMPERAPTLIFPNLKSLPGKGGFTLLHSCNY